MLREKYEEFLKAMEYPEYSIPFIVEAKETVNLTEPKDNSSQWIMITQNGKKILKYCTINMLESYKMYVFVLQILLEELTSFT